MNVKEFLDSRIIPDFENQLVSTLQSVYNGSSSHPLLTRNTAEFTLVLLGRLEGYEVSSNSLWYDISYGSKACKRLIELLPEKEWQDPEAYNLLRYLFGEEKAVYIRHAWAKFPNLMYQTGSYRRSYRSPGRRELYLPNQLNFLKGIIFQTNTPLYDTQYRYIAHDLSISEQILWDHQHATGYGYHMWAAAIDLGNEEVFSLLENIIYNKDNFGKVSSGIIKALLLSNREDAWTLVEKLLLAAQRQEGLRQVVLEQLDDTSTGALIHMLRVIIDHKLMRFSSVVRALDVWAGVNWESEKESAVKGFLEKAHLYMSDLSLVPAAIKSDNNADVLMALWAQGVYDVELTAPYLAALTQSKSVEKRWLAQYFVADTGHSLLNMPILISGVQDESLAVNGLAVRTITQHVIHDAKYFRTYYPELFGQLHALLQRSSVKEKTFDNKPFAWMNGVYRRSEVLDAMIPLSKDDEDKLNIMLSYFDDMDLNVKTSMTRMILPDYAGYSWEEKKEITPLNAFQRAYCMRIIKERGEFLQTTALRALTNIALSAEEAAVLKELLKRKSSSLRSQIIGVLLKQPDDILTTQLQELLIGDGEQRLAGLDISIQLQRQQRLSKEIAPLLDTFRERKTITPKESILLDQLSGDDQGVVYDSSNGYGLYDPSFIAPVVAPKIDPNDLYNQSRSDNEYGFTLPEAGLKKALLDLYNLIQQHRDHEYEVDNYGNSREKVLLGNMFRSSYSVYDSDMSAEEIYATYPLHEVWKAWFDQSGLTARDLFILNELTVQSDYETFEDINLIAKPHIPELSDYLPANMPEAYKYKWTNPLLGITEALAEIYPFADKEEFLIGATTNLFALLPPEVLSYRKKEEYRYYEAGDGWQQDTMLNWYINKLSVAELSDAQVERCWQLYHWRQYSGLPDNIKYNYPPLEIFCKAYQQGLITENEIMRAIMQRDNIRDLSRKKSTHKYPAYASNRRHNRNNYTYLERYPFLEPMFVRVREHLLDIELKRGDTATPVTEYVTEIRYLEGINRFADILAGLGKTTLNKGYVYYSKGENKQQLFSTLLKNCFPAGTDTDEQFAEAMRRIKATETRLLEAAVYAPQWQKFVSRFLDWKGLDAAIWWMHAHTKTSGYAEQTAEAESEIARYSAVDVQDFKDGAVDKDWFVKAYKEIGQERWQQVYDAARYISDGNGHRRARLYADVMTGNLKIKEVTEKVKDKRDQDYLRVYGLVPLSKSGAEKDILSRYEYIQQFKKESKQFGAQKQSSEGIAIRIAMENLARNAGYADPLRLTWAMETKQVQDILSKETQVQYDDVLIGLVIGEDGEADVVAFKGDKKLASIPAKYKKDVKILELLEFKKVLKQQFRRSRQALEEAMVKGDVFEVAELANLFQHPVIARHLEKLVFVTNNGHGFWKDGTLVPAKGEAFQLTARDQIRIAHCVDLHTSGSWADYQHYCFDKQLAQPFKQIFRELYLPTAEELQEKSISRRYAGHQVQPSKTVALLKSRGWKVDYEEGLQKVFHQLGFMVKMYAQANWFSPAEVESPVLEEVIFHRLKTGGNVAFEDIDPRIFSEVMRDIDLVVSVAHAGGVDPEASHSTIEMRTVLLKETLRLFKLDNVMVAGTHAKIAGHYGEYSVHLGSAIVHQMPGRYLSILPVHAQQRGRLFLPFADDDPKSAELMSKVLLLARDKDIQDPTILGQLEYSK
ncbi:DUF4132 domain-containing protein [Chitinophaga rhizophila]|uniref:DUF4132 domain-containing protein n=1 Tax=Chitinophaga rhizophila TaxID=2866212 RepID=A0ABS7GJR8_9BACT|nr:DUF4132 domain-containing protein [Chitinophaga rhizophila]MBW8686999.1 DUF4132 domain-containing protein [Chitinophaga rhizophila]